jgi:hypothetical protein
LVKTSAYTLEETVEKFENACHSLIDDNVQEYVSMLKDIEDELGNTIAKYPEDDEIKEFFADFESFLKDKKSGESVDEKDRLSKFLSDMKHIVHWRKLDMSSGKDLQFKDYRSLRGNAGTRR